MTHSLGFVVNEKEPKAKPTKLEPTWNIAMKRYSEWSNKSPEMVDGIISIMRERNEYGFNKHGAYLTPDNGRNNRNDTAQELLDSIAYVQNEIEELKMSGQDYKFRNLRTEMLLDISNGLFVILETYYMYSKLCESENV